MISHDSLDLVLRKAGWRAAIKMIRQELVAKDLIQKGERNKTIVLMRKGVLQTFSPIH